MEDNVRRKATFLFFEIWLTLKSFTYFKQELTGFFHFDMLIKHVVRVDQITWTTLYADMAELADAPDLGSGIERCEGSSPFIRTI